MARFKKFMKKLQKAVAKPRPKYARRRPMRPRRVAVRRINSVSGGVSNSRFYHGRRRLTKQVLALRRVGAPDTWQDNFSDTVSTQVGLQKFISFGSLLRSQLQQLNSLAGNQGAPNRVLVETASTELTFTNITNAAVEVDIYDIKFKRDIPNTTTVALAAGTYIFNSYPENMITEGAKAAASIAPASLTDPSLYRGAIPYDSQFFKDNCKVIQKTQVMLSSGATHRHQQNVKLNRIASQTVVGNESLSYIKDFSYTTLLCIRGVPVGIAESDDTTTTQSTLNIVSSLRIKWTFVQDATSNLVYNNALPVAGDTQVRNIGNGAIESVTPV